MFRNIIFFIFLLPISMMGQCKDQISNGGDLIQGESNLHGSVGQVFVNQSQTPEATISEGFHQSFKKIETKEALSKTSIFPNPATNWINVNAQSEIIGINIMNLSGQLMSTQSGLIGNPTRVDLTTLPQGIFFIEIQEKNHLKTIQKIIKI